MIELVRRISRLKELIFFFSRLLFPSSSFSKEFVVVDEEMVDGLVCYAVLTQSRVSSFYSKKRIV